MVVITSKYAFCLGVCNVIFSTWLISVYPWKYFLWHSIKNFLLIYIRYITWQKKKWSLFLFDFCYIVNYSSFVYFFLCVLKGKYESFEFLNYLLPKTYGPIFFRIFFSWSTGVLALAIALFENSLVFHSFDHMCILAIHIGPPIVTYTMRWYHNQLEQDWPNTFHIDSSSNDMNDFQSNWFELIILPFLSYIVLWSIPYSVLMFVYLGDDIKKEGWVTMYSYYEKELFPPGWDKSSPLSSYWNEKMKPFLYMSLHAVLCLLTFFLAFVMWHSFWLHTMYLLILIFISIYNGATYYFVVMKKQIIKQYEEENKSKLDNKLK